MRGIKAISEGMDMWITPCPPMPLSTGKLHYQESLSALATNSHVAERGVKTSSFCSLINRPEYLSSAYATARSGLVEPIHAKARNEMEKNTTRRGNRYVSGGKVGQRKRANGEIYEEVAQTTRKGLSRDSINVGDSLQAEQAIKYVTDRCKTIGDACDNSATKLQNWKRLRDGVTKKTKLYSVSRISLKTEEFKSRFHIERQQNVIQKRRGADITPFMLGKVPYGHMNKDRDWENLKIELMHRNLPTNGNWTMCKKRLMEHEGDKKYFKVLSNATFPWH